MPRWPWQDEYRGTSPGWALTGAVTLIVTGGPLVLWVNDMHMYGYGLFGR